jgi:hypothetical protein
VLQYFRQQAVVAVVAVVLISIRSIEDQPLQPGTHRRKHVTCGAAEYGNTWSAGLHLHAHVPEQLETACIMHEEMNRKPEHAAVMIKLLQKLPCLTIIFMQPCTRTAVLAQWSATQGIGSSSW